MVSSTALFQAGASSNTSAVNTAPPPPKAWFFSRWPLHAKVLALRSVAAIAFYFHNSAPSNPHTPLQYIYIDSTLSGVPAKNAIGVAVFRPMDGDGGGKRAAMINFHGGGFAIGSATDDVRWCREVCDELDMVVFSVDYRLAPEHPFPVAVEDGVDAIAAIISRADEFGVDPNNITLSGFSSGGNLALGAWILCQYPTTPHWSYPSLHVHPSAIRGIVLFYPSLDYSIPRAEKVANLLPDCPVLPEFITELFDQSYVYPPRTREQRKDPRLSPGLMGGDLLAACPPVHLVLCQHDALANEARVFGARLQAGGDGRAVVREVEGESHAWDKQPASSSKPSVMVEYMEAVKSMRAWIKA